jgi:hypothetical protein
MRRITNRVAAAPEQPTPPERELPPGWRVFALVWLAAFAGLVAYELLGFAWQALRSLTPRP